MKNRGNTTHQVYGSLYPQIPDQISPNTAESAPSCPTALKDSRVSTLIGSHGSGVLMTFILINALATDLRPGLGIADAIEGGNVNDRPQFSTCK